MATIGRPTIYDPAYCERVIALGKLGHSVAEMCAELDISKQAIYEWEKKFPEFGDAFSRARLYSQAWWERKGRDYIVESPMGERINAGLYSRSMAARFPDDWREKSAVEMSGRNGGPIETDNTFRVEFVSPAPVQQIAAEIASNRAQIGLETE